MSINVQRTLHTNSKHKASMELKHPFTALVCGPTKAGKSVFVKNLVLHSNQLISPPPVKIMWCYAEWQPMYQQLANHVEFFEGVPDLKPLKETPETPKLLIFDDLMQEMKKNEKVLAQVFTRGSHHWNLSCIHIVQNIFINGLRTSRVNAQYIVLMKNPSDKLQAQNLAKQIYPGKTKHFMESYEDACKEPHGYLLIDLNQYTQDNLRLRTNIFPGQLQIAYVPKV
ncbi:MAG: hypothetical protein GY861_01300 [bacterium]|nr:hypothetical protein [bacterium]